MKITELNACCYQQLAKIGNPNPDDKYLCETCGKVIFFTNGGWEAYRLNKCDHEWQRKDGQSMTTCKKCSKVLTNEARINE